MSIAPSKLYLWQRSGIYYIGYVDERGKKHWGSSETHLKGDTLKKLTDLR